MYSLMSAAHDHLRMQSTEMTEKPIVFVVDDDVSIRESLGPLLSFAGWRPIAFASAKDFLARPKCNGPSCLILDVNMPGLSGLDLQGMMTADGRNIPIIFVTGFGDVPMTVRAMKAGAFEFLTKPIDTAALLQAVTAAIARSATITREDDKVAGIQACYDTLTRREREVMSFVVEGYLNKQVAFELDLSEITVKAHRGQVMRKMNARSLPDLVNMAARLRLTDKGRNA